MKYGHRAALFCEEYRFEWSEHGSVKSAEHSRKHRGKREEQNVKAGENGRAPAQIVPKIVLCFHFKRQFPASRIFSTNPPPRGMKHVGWHTRMTTDNRNRAAVSVAQRY